MSLALIGAGSEPITESRGDCGSHRFVIHIGMVVQPAEPEPEPDRLQAATWHLQGVNGKQQRADAANKECSSDGSLSNINFDDN